MTDAPSVKPTVASAMAAADMAAESASTALSITQSLEQGQHQLVETTAAQTVAIDKLQQEQVTLAKLLNGLKREPGESVRPSKVDNLAARLEKVEQQVQGEHGLITTLQGFPHPEDLITNVQTVTAELDKLKQAFTGYDAPVAVGQVMSEIAQLRDHVDAVSRQPAGLDTIHSQVRDSLTEYLQGEIRQLVAHRASFEQDLLARLENLEGQLPQWGRTSGESRLGMESNAPAVGGVYRKVLALMDEVAFIGANQEAKGGGVRYMFRGIKDAQNAVGAAMRRVRVLLQPEVVSWEHSQHPVTSFDDKDREKTVTWSTSRLTMRYLFVDPDDGSVFSMEMVGEGKDNSDKSASKAASMACKYALFQALMIPFEQVDESDGNHVVEEDYQPLVTLPPREVRDQTPGARVNRGETTPAVAVQEYSRSGGYDAGSDPSAMAGAIEEPTMSNDQLMHAAATAAQYLRKAQAQPSDVALPAIQKTKARIAELGIGDLLIEGVPLASLVAAALQSVMAGVNTQVRPGAQGLSRQAQLSGEGARAAAPVDGQHPVTDEEYDRALKIVADPRADEREVVDALVITRRYEAQQVSDDAVATGSLTGGDYDY